LGAEARHAGSSVPVSLGREPIPGVLTRYNKKTVTFITEQGQRWNVSLAALRNVKDVGAALRGPNVVALRKK
jgi:hypothetical protein